MTYIVAGVLVAVVVLAVAIYATKRQESRDRQRFLARAAAARGERPDRRSPRPDRTTPASAAAGPAARAPSVRPPARPSERPRGQVLSPDYEEITLVTLEMDVPTGEDDVEIVIEEEQPSIPPIGVAHVTPIIADPGAEDDEPTRDLPLILVSAAGQSDRGQRRERNEDRFLSLIDHGVFAVADGMGGYEGGEIAAELAVTTLAEAFDLARFEGTLRYTGERWALPRRAAELARAIQMANLGILAAAEASDLHGMGTTLVAARFASKKDRVYIGHVGDSRCYRLRDGKMHQLTTDHTLRLIGMDGPHSNDLIRAVGIKPKLEIDLIIAKAQVGDTYLLCSDGLTKMVVDEGEILALLAAGPTPRDTVARLVDTANERGGLDNVTVIIVTVQAADEGRAAVAAPQ